MLAASCCDSTHEIRCSTDGSTGVVLSDLRNVERPGACIVAPWAILGGRSSDVGVVLQSLNSTYRLWGRGAVATTRSQWLNSLWGPVLVITYETA
jgi:hypothetical protein